MPQKRTTLIDRSGNRVSASCPVIVSASRRSDIPCYFAESFARRFEEGYVKCTGRYGTPYFVSFEKTRFVVFWTKHPNPPFFDLLDRLDERRIGYYIQYTVNDYERGGATPDSKPGSGSDLDSSSSSGHGSEGLEPGIPDLNTRVERFKRLSKRVGRTRIIWRFDPLLLTRTIPVNRLLEALENVGRRLLGYTGKLVISFADIDIYRSVARNLQAAGIDYLEWDEINIRKLAAGLARLNTRWKIEIAACCEHIDLTEYGIKRNKCIDDELIERIAPSDRELISYLSAGGRLKDPSQRKECLCIGSTDIGEYDTCRNLCLYCYANRNRTRVEWNLSKLSSASESICIQQFSI